MKDKSRFKLIILLTSLALVSCVKLPVYQSISYTASEKDDFLNPMSGNYDKKIMFILASQIPTQISTFRLFFTTGQVL